MGYWGIHPMSGDTTLDDLSSIECELFAFTESEFNTAYSLVEKPLYNSPAAFTAEFRRKFNRYITGKRKFPNPPMGRLATINAHVESCKKGLVNVQ